MKNELALAPNGARYSIYVQWKLASEKVHVFVAEKVGKKIRYIDLQTSNKDVSQYFLMGIDRRFGYLRMDNKNITTDL
ncbi:MAG: hypothetical protein FWG63_01590 [Defluviitaleaceae bacterium]|nr:hypothetical protein [Defluviitaleaceae bacterium]